MSIPDRMIRDIREKSEQILDEKLADDHKRLIAMRTKLAESERKLESLELKWIDNAISADTYNRWYGELNSEIVILKQQVAELQRGKDEVVFLLKNELDKLTDLGQVYHSGTLSQKQELVRKWFDNRLYYQNGVYRTGYIMTPSVTTY